MNERDAEELVLTENMIEDYRKLLDLDEYSQSTIEKYMRDIRLFFSISSRYPESVKRMRNRL